MDRRGFTQAALTRAALSISAAAQETASRAKPLNLKISGLKPFVVNADSLGLLQGLHQWRPRGTRRGLRHQQGSHRSRKPRSTNATSSPISSFFADQCSVCPAGAAARF
jgi:hypothetical protein